MKKKVIIAVVSAVVLSMLGFVGFHFAHKQDEKRDDAPKEIVEDVSEVKTDTDSVVEPEEILEEAEAEVEVETVQKSFSDNDFPELNIVYPDDWELSTNETDLGGWYDIGSGREDFSTPSKEIVLSKGDTTLLLDLERAPAAPGCGDPAFDTKLDVSKILRAEENNELARFKDVNEDMYIYGTSTEELYEQCIFNKIFSIRSVITDETLLDSPLAGDYTDLDGNVVYWVYMSVVGTDHLDEADQILLDSTLR